MSPVTCKLLLTVVVPVAAPILNAVAALAKFTVVAVVLIKSKLVDPVVIDVVNAGLVPNTNTPVPVSSEITVASSADVVAKNADSLSLSVYATWPPALNANVELSVPENATELVTVNVLLSVPATVIELLAVNVLPFAIVSTELVAGAVIVTLLTVVAVATPMSGVINVGEVSTTNLVPVPVWLVIDVTFPVPVIGPVMFALVTTQFDVKLVTGVVDVTTSGAVPCAAVAVN